jgi:UDP-N-acetylglucosamine 2-epimerase (non-hydrolysing)
VLGTRPEAIKLAPLISAMRDTSDLEPWVISTGQHREMLAQVLDIFQIHPDIDLALHRSGQTLAGLAASVGAALDVAYSAAEPDVVVVQGDTTTTLVGALTAFYRRIPVVHLEAGLRSGDVSNPFPEEANRRLVAPITALHLAATDANARALWAEGVRSSDVIVTGNTVIDALYETLRRKPAVVNPEVAGLLDSRHRLVTVTAHRRESWGRPLEQIALAVRDVAHEPGIRVVWPLHANPDVQSVVRGVVGEHPRISLVEPLSYGDFVQLLAASDVAISDSGGVQEECPALGVPVVVTRNVTERCEAVEAGAAVLAGTDRRRIVRLTAQLLARPRSEWPPSPYGDGLAAQRSLQAIRHLVSGTPMPRPFSPGLRPIELTLNGVGTAAS